MTYEEYFTKLHNQVVAKKIFTTVRNINNESWLGYSYGSYFNFSCVFVQKASNNRLAVELYIDGGKRKGRENQLIFEALLKSKEEIENKLGKLKWEKLEDKRACRIEIVFGETVSLDNSNEKINEYINWQVENLKKFKEVFTELYGKNFSSLISDIDFSGLTQEDEIRGEEKDEWQRRQIQFREWAVNTVKSASSIDSYIRYSMNNKIPQKLIEIGEKDNSFKSIFEITDMNWLEKFYERLIKGDLNNFNENTANRQPSASLKKYIEFLTSIKDNNGHKGIFSNEPLNQILYGPPGTGKTYKTIDKALEIIDGFVPTKRADAKDRFEKLTKLGQIKFVTFHQSYGYEEFVEGIKADVKSEEIKYKLEDGIFKRLSFEALFEAIEFDDFQKDLNYEELYEILVNKYKKGQTLILKSKDNKEIEIRDISKNDNLHCYHKDSDVRHIVGKDRLKKLYDEYSSLEELNSLSGFQEEFKRIIGGANQTVYWTILYQLLIYKEEIKKEEVDERIDYETKKELIKNSKSKYKDDTKDTKNFILIIDEINRGNISKIFGELITLIEDSKRAGKDESVEIILPYSGEKFLVPQNLYIIGTMNTADRSIALMDTALRRRFEFEEMMPNLAVVSQNTQKIVDFNSNEQQKNDLIIDEINIRLLLKKINQRIEYLYDRDHTIGHAYFMSLKEKDGDDAKVELDSIFRNKVIPLLQEYFYDDWEKIRLVLGDNQKIGDNEKYQFVRINDNYDVSKLFGSIGEVDLNDEQKVFEINKDAFGKPESYRQVYETK
jgi:5-methylcytosine-specific restriction protein B